MANVENSLVSIFTLFPKYVIFTPKYGQSVLGHTIRDFLGSMERKVGCERERERVLAGWVRGGGVVAVVIEIGCASVLIWGHYTRFLQNLKRRLYNNDRQTTNNT